MLDKWAHYDTPPKLLDRLNYKSKGENNERIRNWVCSLACNTLGVKRHCWGFGMGIRISENLVNYSHEPAQTKQQVG
jgi:hypothetical protein